MHRHTPLTPVSLCLFQLVPVVLHVRELAGGRPRPTVGDDITWFLTHRPDDRVPWPPGSTRLHASYEPRGSTSATTGFPVRVQVVNWAVRGPADDRRPVGGTEELRDVHRPGKLLAGRDRRDVHVLVDLAVRRASAADAVADVGRER
ncbi:hypothetical protein ACFQ46_23690 [Kineococcus sp. GCM10028916]|uniref:hypothetical protein n=1 Tax=Kineococcus sp. GCM10028916 TaxID=3273394 RepID=UPI0036327179